MKKYFLPVLIVLFLTTSFAYAGDDIINYIRKAVSQLQKDVVELKSQNFGQKITNLETVMNEKMNILDQKFSDKIQNLEVQLASSKPLKVYDATDKEIGYIIDYSDYSLVVRIFDINIKKIYTLELDTGKIPHPNISNIPVFGLFFSLSENCNGPFAVNKKLSPYDIAHQNSDPFLGFYTTKSYSDLQNDVLGKSVKAEDGTCTNKSFIEDYASIVEPIKLPTYVGPLEIKF